ncbi:hypothetical protein M595_0327 [Lyngbya aestuarii BL J]|uniref:Uncharacterized protein n=1 Tax=Lyngbya aestuarii BL J TaxID=1348334 RepID=U7QNZ6_9CYAN|nr:hypothetical protein [Lyngbya aestuarii]ERT09704.1 hypothetical protein M595_0327 [Lyngbya aestuarii BL J]
MATIVEHQKSGKRYIVMGTGFGIYKSARNNAFFEWAVVEEEDNYHLVAVCDRKGKIKWFYSDDLVVVEVDGKPPEDLL